MMNPTQRTYTDIETGEIYTLYSDDRTHQICLIAESGKKPKGFYICAHSGMTIKIDNKKQIELTNGTFYNVKEGERITHKKYIGFKRFSKL